MSLDLKPRDLADADLQSAAIFGCELVIADELEAYRLRDVLGARPTLDAGVEPTLVAVVSNTDDRRHAEAAGTGFGGVLLLPEKPALLTAQLSVILYAARAFSLRYQSAIEELRLNRRIFQSVTSGISIADATAPDMPLLYVNPGFEMMTGYCLEEVQGIAAFCRTARATTRDWRWYGPRSGKSVSACRCSRTFARTDRRSGTSSISRPS